jgi:hypothetical protein
VVVTRTSLEDSSATIANDEEVIGLLYCWVFGCWERRIYWFVFLGCLHNEVLRDLDGDRTGYQGGRCSDTMSSDENRCLIRGSSYMLYSVEKP